MSRRKWIFFASFVLIMAIIAIQTRSINTKTQSEERRADETLIASTSTSTSTSPTTTTFPVFSSKKLRTPSSAGGSINPELIRFLKKSDPDAEWSILQSNSKRVSAISGGLLHEDLTEPGRALEFARKLAQLMGHDPQQVVSSRKTMSETAETQSASFSQEIDGYPVFGSEMNIFTRKKDGAIYYITNELYSFQKVETRISFGLREAAMAVNSFYQASSDLKIEHSFEQPVLVSKTGNENEAELCWQIQIRIAKPRFQRRILFLSAHTLKVIRDVNLVVAN